MRRLNIRYIVIAALILIAVLLRWFNIGSSINVAFFQKNAAFLHNYIAEHYLFAVALYIAFYALITLCAIPITPILNVAAGYFFTFIWGTVYAVIAATTGATGTFLAVRYIWGSSVSDRYAAKLATFNQQFEKHGAFYLLFLQLLPITPFSIISVIAGISHVALSTFIWTTVVGIIPGTALYVFAGKSLMEITTISDIISAPIIIGFCALAGLSLLPLLIDFVRGKKH